MVASIHVMISFQKSNTALKASIILVIATFIGILYATFLTRSGILGNASVHSFTDLGLSGQLLIYLFAFLILALFYTVKAWRYIPTSAEEISMYSREFWIFIGATVLCLGAFQVLSTTSIPVYNAFVKFFGVESNLAPPADAVEHYTKFQLWVGIAIAFLSGTGQFFWWKKMDIKQLKEALTVPAIITMLSASVALIIFKINQWQYITLLTLAFYSIVSNTSILVKILKNNPKLSGGAVSHIGIALMLLGILASAGYSKTVSLNNTGMLYNREFSEEMNKENLLLFRQQPQKMLDYSLTYKGLRVESKDLPCYIDKEILKPTIEAHKVITTEDITCNGKTYFTKGDTVEIYNENTYYEIEYAKDNGQVFHLYPRVQMNEKMGATPLPSPDIKHTLTADLYTHVTNIPDNEEAKKWSEPEEQTLAIGDTFVINDFIAILDDIRRGQQIEDEDINVIAYIRLLGRNKTYELKPAYLIKTENNMVRKVSATNEALGVKITLDAIKPEDRKFTFSVQSSQKDWIIMKAVEKPLINILWIGTILMAIGMCIALVRRYQDSKQETQRTARKAELVK
jgi:cytochrome c-type biogenesis protein CcmF